MADYLHFMRYSDCNCPEALRKIAETLERMEFEHSPGYYSYHEQAEAILQALSEARKVE